MSEIFKEIEEFAKKFDTGTLKNAQKEARQLLIDCYHQADIPKYAHYSAIENICERLIIIREVLYGDFPKENTEKTTKSEKSEE
jgi:hypothetical protein